MQGMTAENFTPQRYRNSLIPYYHLEWNDLAPECSHCYCALTVAHVLLECNHYNVVRQRYFNVSSLHELFDTVNAQNILGFIRDIGLYRLL